MALGLIFGIAGCGGSADNSSQSNASVGAKNPSEQTGQAAQVSQSTEPVTLSLFLESAMSDEDLQRSLYEPLKKKYPYITVNAIKKDKSTTINTLIAAGETPDLYNVWVGGAGDLVQAKVTDDITPLAKKDNIDLSRFQPVIMDTVKEASGNGQMIGLPRFSNTVALYYNKDIFDKFGVPYPKDGMTWDQTIELEKKVTRTDGGIHYLGLGFDGIYRSSFPYSLSPVDPKTNKATINTDAWRKVMQLNRDIYAVPGNLPADSKGFPNGTDHFIQQKDQAMLAAVNILWRIEDAKNGLNWDMAQYPSFPDKMNVGGMVDVHVVGVTNTSKHKDAAIKVADLMTSDDVQLIMARQSAQASTLVNPEMKKQFGAEAPFLKGKNLQAFFKSKSAPAPATSVYLTAARGALTPIYTDFIFGKKDLNTTIREAEDAINKSVEAAAAK
jgi:multiple sugar transport system substrate-binding protein